MWSGSQKTLQQHDPIFLAQPTTPIFFIGRAGPAKRALDGSIKNRFKKKI